MIRSLGLLSLGLFGLMGLMAYIRLAPDDPAQWHVSVPVLAQPGIAEVPGGALAFLAAPDPEAALARLAERAATLPRVRLLAGSPAEGRMTWVARSAFWGFPDYITAEIGPSGLRLWSRQRFGSADLGVNRARLADWIDAL